MEENEDIDIKDLLQELDEERAPFDDKEDFGADKNEVDYSVNSSFSVENDPHLSTRDQPQATGTAKDDGQMLNEIEEFISNPYAEMPEFYSRQIDFDPIEGLPGNQHKQLIHKSITILKDKYWNRVSKDIFELATAKIPRPIHLNKMLSLYLIHQKKLREEKLDSQREESGKPKSLSIPATTTKRSVDMKRVMFVHQPISRRASTLMQRLSSKQIFKKAIFSPSNRSSQTSTVNLVSEEMQKKIENLNKKGIETNREELAISSKHLLCRLPFIKRDLEGFTSPEKDLNFTRKFTKYIFSSGMMESWKEKCK